jgi:hypothetical protein
MNTVDERFDDRPLGPMVTDRRTIAKGAAAGGLAALFAAVGAGRVLAAPGPGSGDTTEDSPDSPDTTPDDDDSLDTTPGNDPDDTTPDDGETTNDEAVRGQSRGRGRGRGRRRGRGRGGRG